MGPHENIKRLTRSEVEWYTEYAHCSRWPADPSSTWRQPRKCTPTAYTNSKDTHPKGLRMGSCQNALSMGKRPPYDILLRTKLFNPRQTRAKRSKRHSGGCISVSSSKPNIQLGGSGWNRILPGKPACTAGKGGGPRHRLIPWSHNTNILHHRLTQV